MSKRSFWNSSSPFIVLFVALFSFVVGSCFEKKPVAVKAPYKDLEKFSKVMQYIEANYVEPVKSTDLVDGAIKGMLETLDPHSAYLSPEIFREMKVETSGNFGGLGIEVSIVDGIITVVSPIEDTPAFRAGVKAGDRIVRIDGKSTKNISLPQAVTMMRGKLGSKISITVVPKDSEKPKNFVLTRESVKIQSVHSSLIKDRFLYAKISSFQERTGDDLGKAIDRLSKKSKIEGVILDLRGNPGGLLDQAVRVANLFIDEGPIVYTIGRDRSKREIESAQKGRRMTDAPMVVLLDGSSASASEIVAGALQDYGRAVIAGQQSFGKGSVQTIIPLGDEAGLKVTVARYYTPSGRSIQVKGITPDVLIDNVDPKVVEASQKSAAHRLREADLERHFDNEEDGAPLPPKESVVETEKAPVVKKDAGPLPLEERLKSDFMVLQAQGILQTMKVVKSGLKKPEFKIDDESSKDKNKNSSKEIEEDGV